MKSLIACIVLIATAAIVAIPAAAQADETPSVPVVPAFVLVDRAQVEWTPDGALALRVQGGLATGCDLPVQVDIRLQDDALIVSLYENLPIDMFCTRILIPYNEVIPLNIDRDDLPDRVLVNDVEAAFALGAQDAPVSNMPAPARVPYVIDDVTLTRTIGADGEAVWIVTISGTQTDSCMFPMMIDERASTTDWLALDLYRLIPANVRCAGETIPFTRSFTLSGPFNPDPTLQTLVAAYWVVEVNDFVALVNFIAPAGGFTVADYGEIVLAPARRLATQIDNVVARVSRDQVTLSISGSYATGCQFPTRIRQAAGDRLRLEMYDVLPDDDMLACPAILRLFTEEVTLTGVFAPGTYAFSVNGFEGTFVVLTGEASMPGDSAAVAHTITDVQVLIAESFPVQVLLQITGYQPDGCTFPVQVDHVVEGRTVTVDIYRIMPLAVMCPAVIINYDQTLNLGSLPAGRYTFIVNEVVVEADVP